MFHRTSCWQKAWSSSGTRSGSTKVRLIGLNTFCMVCAGELSFNQLLCDWCRSEVTRLSGRDLGLLLLWCSLDAAGHLPSGSGTQPSSESAGFCLCCHKLSDCHRMVVIVAQFCSFLCPWCLQGKEPSVRQLALLHFRNTIVLSVKLEDALSRPRARVPPSVTQMLLILQVGLQALFG